MSNRSKVGNDFIKIDKEKAELRIKSVGSKKKKMGPPSKKKLTDKARDVIEKDKSEGKMSSFSKVAKMLTNEGFTGAAGEKGKVHATKVRKKLNRKIFKGGESKQVPKSMNMGGVLKNRGGTYKGTY